MGITPSGARTIVTDGRGAKIRAMRWLAFAAILVPAAVMAALIEYPNFKRVEHRTAKTRLVDSVELPYDIN
jgi:hypothetical protein